MTAEALCDGARCAVCDNFERHVEIIENPLMIWAMRKNLIAQVKPAKGGRLGEIASWVADKVVFTPGFFLVCNILAFTPLVWPGDDVFKTVNWISSNWWQLVLLPLIGMAQKRQDRLNEFMNQRQYRILLLSERLDEIKGDR